MKFSCYFGPRLQRFLKNQGCWNVNNLRIRLHLNSWVICTVKTLGTQNRSIFSHLYLEKEQLFKNLTIRMSKMLSELFPWTSTEWGGATAVNERAKNLYDLDLAQCGRGSSNQAHGSMSLVSLYLSETRKLGWGWLNDFFFFFPESPALLWFPFPSFQSPTSLLPPSLLLPHRYVQFAVVPNLSWLCLVTPQIPSVP